MNLDSEFLDSEWFKTYDFDKTKKRNPSASFSPFTKKTTLVTPPLPPIGRHVRNY